MKYVLTTHDKYIKDNHGVDPAILAYALKRTERFVIRRQIRLGLRKCRPSRRSRCDSSS